MARSNTHEIARTLLRLYGRTFAEDLGIRAPENQPSPLFCLLISALLFSTRISHNIALKSARIVFEHGWTTPESMAASTWEQRVQALDEGGYVRYDERTSTMLGETAQMLINLYQGDLRRLRIAAEADPAQERRLLDQFKGVGDTAINIYFREAQLAWPELFPFADERALASAKKLGLPADSRKLASLVRGRKNFVRLVSALVRVDLEHKHDEILARLANRSGSNMHQSQRSSSVARRLELEPS
jgi:hypothetical protein